MKRINELKEYDKFTDLMVVLNSVQKWPFSNKPGHYYSLDVMDKSGCLTAKMWDTKGYENLIDLYQEKGYLYLALTGEVDPPYKKDERPNAKVQLRISSLKVLKNEEVDISNFVPSLTPERRKKHFEKLKELISIMDDEEYKNVVQTVIFSKEYFLAYLNAIGGLKMHHNYIGGTLEHSIQVVIDALGKLNESLFPDLNKNILIAGGLLHDIGKIKEYRYPNLPAPFELTSEELELCKACMINPNVRNFAMNPRENTHTYTGQTILATLIERYNVQISDEKIFILNNIIASHHGPFGDNAVRFESNEAVTIFTGDYASSQINGRKMKQGMMDDEEVEKEKELERELQSE